MKKFEYGRRFSEGVITYPRHPIVRQKGSVIGWCVVKAGMVFVGHDLASALRRAGLGKDQTFESHPVERGDECFLGFEVVGKVRCLHIRDN